MGKTTRYQAVRTALQDLGPNASREEVARYVKQHYGLVFEDDRALALYINMVNNKMARKFGKVPPSSPSNRAL